MRALLVMLIASSLVVGCDTNDSGDGGGGAGKPDAQKIDPTPENKQGIPSQEFEPEDIDRAENASEAVKEYCSDAVSEAQRVGCESHVDESDIP